MSPNESNPPAGHESADKNTSLLQVEQWHVRMTVLRYRLRRKATPQYRLRWYLLEWGRGIWFELRSCWLRIGRIRGTTTGVDLGLWGETDATGDPLPCKSTFGHIQGIELLLSERPWASPEDERVFLKGWDAGVEWVRRDNDTFHSGRECTAEKAL